MFMKRNLIAAASAAFIMALALPAQANDIIEELAHVKAPAAPALKPGTVEPKTTALLVMDLLKQSCNDTRRPRCVASIPAIEKFIATARAKGVTVIYSTIPPIAIGDTLPTIAPKPDDPVVTA